MAVVSRSLFNIGAGLLSARASTRLKRGANAAAAQDKVFAGLIPKLAGGATWKYLGVEAGMKYAEFRSQVPLQTYQSLDRDIERMRTGEADVLWPGACQIYATTSGTAGGSPRYIPVTEAMLAHFRYAGLNSVLWYAVRAGNSRVFRGRHLQVGGSTALTPIPESAPFEAYAGELSGIAALNLPGWVEKHLHEPGAEVAQIADWDQKVAAVTERTMGLDISLVSGLPGWILDQARSLRERSGGGTLKEIWPHLECCVHSGVPLAPYHDKLARALGGGVNFHEVYVTSEGFVAAQDEDAAAGLRVMADAGIFFEFLPMSVYEESRVPDLGSKAVPLSGVAVGVDYALIMTAPSGLARYVVGDVVRFVSLSPARLTYSGRTGLRLNAFGENVSEREVTDALVGVCQRNGWTITNFHVAPIFSRSTMGRVTGRHEWWVELEAGTLITPTGPIIAPEVDAEIKRVNKDYDVKRSSGALEAPFVRLVMPGVFEHWMRYHKKWGGQHKMPRCSSDRKIADELGAALQFAKD